MFFIAKICEIIENNKMAAKEARNFVPKCYPCSLREVSGLWTVYFFEEYFVLRHLWVVVYVVQDVYKETVKIRWCDFPSFTQS